MSDCDKLKKKAIIGAGLIGYLIIGRLVDLSPYIGVGLEIILAAIFTIAGLYLLMPYLGCLSDFNNSHKPPHQKL